MAVNSITELFSDKIQPVNEVMRSISLHAGVKYRPSHIMEIGGMVFNATFNNISVGSWWSVSLVEGTGGHGENH